MISIILLLKIVGGICLAAGLIYLYGRVRRTAGFLQRLSEHFDERLTALESAAARNEEVDGWEQDLVETRQKALEAERRFSEGMASILNFSYMPSRDASADLMTSENSATGKKGD